MTTFTLVKDDPTVILFAKKLDQTYPTLFALLVPELRQQHSVGVAMVISLFDTRKKGETDI